MLRALFLVALCAAATAQPFLPGQGLLPLGNLRTSDNGGPYNLTLLSTQINEIKGGLAAKQNFTDKDVIEFLTNVECLEGLFDTWGTFGRGFNGNLELGGPVPKGARQANLTDRTRAFMQEVALNEQGHALFTRHAGSALPCPVIDFDGGFNVLMAAAYNLTKNQTVQSVYGSPFDPFKNDQNFILSVLSLEELGATGNKGLVGLMTNPVLANGLAGLATSATAQATVERFLLWEMRNLTIDPFNETAQQVFARISAVRDLLDGPQFDDQGLVNTDVRTIAVPDNFVNLIPTDVHGLTFSRTPQQVIRIVTVGAPTSKGAFFPNGLGGTIVSSAGYNETYDGLEDFVDADIAEEQSVEDVGGIPPPLTIGGPYSVIDQTALTQATTGRADNGTAFTRGLISSPQATAAPFFSSDVAVSIGTPYGVLQVGNHTIGQAAALPPSPHPLHAQSHHYAAGAPSVAPVYQGYASGGR